MIYWKEAVAFFWAVEWSVHQTEMSNNYSTEQINMEFGTHIYFHLRMNCNDSDGRLNIILVSLILKFD